MAQEVFDWLLAHPEAKHTAVTTGDAHVAGYRNAEGTAITITDTIVRRRTRYHVSGCRLDAGCRDDKE